MERWGEQVNRAAHPRDWWGLDTKKRKKRESVYVQNGLEQRWEGRSGSLIFKAWTVISWILEKYSLRRQFHHISQNQTPKLGGIFHRHLCFVPKPNTM
jgi:hypothetical protein